MSVKRTAASSSGTTPDILANILQQKHVLDSLLKTGNSHHHGSNSSSGSSDRVSAGSWCYSKDQEFSTMALVDVLTSSSSSSSATLETEITSVEVLMEQIQHWREEVVQGSISLPSLEKKLWFALPSKSFPKLKNPSVSIEKVKKLLADETLIISVCSYAGYNFSSEYSLVYKGVFSPLRAYEDVQAMIQKALKSTDPILSAEKLLYYSSYILKRALWEYMLYLDIFQHTVQEYFPEMKSFTTSKNIPVNHMRIFVGKDINHELSFTIRLEDEVILLDEKANRPSASNLIKLVYYHDYSLELRAVNLFTELMTQSMESMDAMISLNPEVAKILEDSNKSIRFFMLFPNVTSLGKEVQQLLKAKEAEEEESAEAKKKDQGDGEDKDVLLESAFHPHPTCESSLCAEVIGWGYDAYYSLGMGDTARSLALGDERDEIFSPRPIPMLRNIIMEKVRMIACSARHSILLTRFGNMYACGDNTDGALGLGDFLPRHAFTLVDWSPTSGKKSHAGAENVSVAPKITYVAVGCGIIGTHSVCIDSEGQLYSWGYSKATGLGTTKAVTTPTQVSFKPPVSESIEDDKTQQPVKVRTVACGDCFTVCVTMSGHVYSWGQWSHGRLGLGAIPQASIQPRSRGVKVRNLNKLARYQLRPARILHIENAVNVACGEAHTLCILATGHLLAWGQNSLGQIGVGPNKSGLMKDVFAPLAVAHFGPSFSSQDEVMSVFLPKENNRCYESEQEKSGAEKPNAAQVFCGAFHSICVDDQGRAWTWGARGSPCLGQADSMLLGDWASKVNTIFSISTNETQAMVPYELLNWCMKWSMPRLVQALEDLQVQNVVAGDLHTVFHTKDGKIFLCGSGPVVPAFEPPPSRQYDDDEVVPLTQTSNTDKALKGYLISNPRCPSSSWMKELCTRFIQYISGAGSRMFVIVDEEYACTDMTMKLYKKLLAKDNEEEDDDKDDDNVSVDSRYTDVSNRYNSYFESRGKADCLILASGHVFLCHRALLACRSSELRNMILMESPTDGTHAIVQILLPELHYDAAKALFYFLYRDQLPNWALSNVSILHALIRSSKSLHIPRLQLLCERFVDLLSNKVSTTSMDQVMIDLPPTTLCKDLGSLVGDMEFADVRFIAEGRTLVAHRFILENKCEYFQMMFQSGMREGQLMSNQHQMLDVVVPDTFVGFLRLLIFIYTNSLPDGSDGALLEDLMAADRYGVVDMKLLCENMLIPTRSNWLDLLRVSELLTLPRLKQNVITFLRDNFHALRLDAQDLLREEDGEGYLSEGEQNDHFVKALREEFPSLLEDILLSRSEYFPLAPSTIFIEQTTESKQATALAQRPQFPLWALALAAACLFLYQHVSTIIPLGITVPIMNVTGAVVFAGIVIRMLMSSS